MIKKSLAIALLSVSVLALGACSSDDDDETTPTTTGGGAVTGGAVTGGAADGGAADGGAADGGAADGGAADGGAADGGAADGGAADGGAADGGAADGGIVTGGDGYPAGSLADVVLQDGRATTALSAMEAIGLDLALNSTDNNQWTIFLPSNDAIAAAPDGTVLDLAVFRAHIYSEANLTAADAVGNIGNTVTMNDNTTMVAIGGTAEALTVGGHAVIGADLMGNTNTAIVHIIDGIITP